ncbi:MAG: alkaline phosphatase, partial [Planctomycetota bacterium]
MRQKEEFGTKGTRVTLCILFLSAAICQDCPAQPKNVILMIGDGMGFEQVAAAGMYLNGSPGTLCFEAFPHQGQVTTRSANSQVTDSAASATAMATGHKVNNGVISMAFPGGGGELK